MLTIRRFLSLLLLAAVAATATACGSATNGSAAAGGAGAGDPRALLADAFANAKALKSGVVSMRAQLSGGGQKLSATLDEKFSGAGTGQPPQMQLSGSFDAGGQSGSGGVVWDGRHGFVTLDGSSYRLPASVVKSFTQGTQGGAPATLGIDPSTWLKNPRLDGSAQVDGVAVDQVSGDVDTAKLIGDVQSLMAKGSALGGASAGAGMPQLSAGDLQMLTGAVKQLHATFSIGQDDHALRKARLDLRIAPAGEALSGSVELTISGQNVPQTITAPTGAKPYGELKQQLGGLLGMLGSASAAEPYAKIS